MQRIDQFSPVMLDRLCAGDVVDGFVAKLAAEDMTGVGWGVGVRKGGQRSEVRGQRSESETDLKPGSW